MKIQVLKTKSSIITSNNINKVLRFPLFNKQYKYLTTLHRTFNKYVFKITIDTGQSYKKKLYGQIYTNKTNIKRITGANI